MSNRMRPPENLDVLWDAALKLLMLMSLDLFVYFRMSVYIM